MRGQKRVYVVDFDNTLIDAQGIKAYWQTHFYRKFPKKGKRFFLENYEKSKSKTGFLDVSKLSKALSLDEEFFLETPFAKFLFPGIMKSLKNLKKSGRVIIHTLGKGRYQPAKIKKSGIEKIVSSRNIIITHDKQSGTEKLIRRLRKEKFDQIVVFDDTAAILERATRTYPSVITVWIRYGKNKNKLPILKNSITFDSRSFNEGAGFAERVIGTISSPKSHLKFPVLKGIDKEQIKDLVSYTGRDRKISVCTHDDGRFRNIKTFTSWRKRGKIIYTLINRTGRLLGIIWFAKKKYRNYPFTIAVRTYPPIRGKGLSYQFMKNAYDNFKPKHSKEGLWLSMQRNNTPAKHLYKKFGFVKSEEKNSEVILTLK